MGDGIIWLASYPKSGNTWMRIFLHNYLLNSDEPADINALEGVRIASSRHLFDALTGIESSDLSPDEIDRLRPEVYRAFAMNYLPGEQLNEFRFLKVHDAYTYLPEGQPLFPIDATRGVIYVVRNPFDLSVSLSHFMNVDIKTSISFMNSERFTLLPDANRIESQFRQRLHSWSGHISSWLNIPNTPLLLIRYEDMISTPEEAFGAVLKFLDLPNDTSRLKKAIAFSSFDILKSQEEKKGFRERPAYRPFFRSGKSGVWKNILRPEYIDCLINKHRDMLVKLEYIRENKIIV